MVELTWDGKYDSDGKRVALLRLKLLTRFGFSISYTDSRANLCCYKPDFVAVTTDGVHHLLETKGREDAFFRRESFKGIRAS